MVKATISETETKGQGVFATQFIETGKIIFDWEDGGIIFEASRASMLPNEVKNYAIQFDREKWIDTEKFGRYLNHSCSPNAGIHGLYKLVAIKDIQPGEEIVWDYDTTENSDWIMPGGCNCMSPRCRKIIKGYQFLPEKLKEEYRDITSDWLK